MRLFTTVGIDYTSHFPTQKVLRQTCITLAIQVNGPKYRQDVCCVDICFLPLRYFNGVWKLMQLTTMYMILCISCYTSYSFMIIMYFVCQKWLVENIEYTLILLWSNLTKQKNRCVNEYKVYKMFSKSLSAITLKIMILRLPLIILRHRLIVFRWLQILFCYTNCFISCKSQHQFSVWIKSQRAEMIALDACQKRIACL